MALEKITYKPVEDGPEHSFEFDFGSNLEEATKKFGADVVFSLYRSAGTVRLQGMARTHAKGTKDTPPKKPDVIAKELDAHKFKLKAKPKSLKDKMAALLDQLPEKEREAFMAEMRKAKK